MAAAAVALVPLTQAWNIELPPCIEPFKPFVYSGCFQDGNPNALIFRSSIDQNNMTVEKCIAECKGKSLKLALTFVIPQSDLRHGLYLKCN